MEFDDEIKRHRRKEVREWERIRWLAWQVWIQNPNIKKGLVPTTPDKILTLDIDTPKDIKKFKDDMKEFHKEMNRKHGK